MFKLFSVLFAAAGAAAVCAVDIPQDEQDYARRNMEAERLAVAKKKIPAVELNVRGGLPEFFRKAKAGEPVTVAYFGGSITAHRGGWSTQSFANLQKAFPNCKMTMVNGSMGGTGSIFGVFRADQDLVAKKPDLVFIEFAVNDGGDSVRKTRDVMRALEGIVRKVKKANPKTDICFVYTIQNHNLKDLIDGKAQPAVGVHEEVAKYYNLPSIYFGPAVAKLVKEGKAVGRGKVADKATGKDADGKLVFTEDNTHPVIPTGHAVYAGVVQRVLPQLEKGETPYPAQLPPPMFGESWELAKNLPLDGNAVFSGNWKRDGKGMKTITPGSSMTVKFKGTVVGLTEKVGPGSGIVKHVIDDGKEVKSNRFSVYGNSYRTSGGPLPEVKNGVHTVTWTLTDDKFDKGKILASYYRKGNDRKYRENPALFKDNGFYPLQIMLVGEIVK